MTTFLLKINGQLHGPRGIARPTGDDWDGGEILMDWSKPRSSSNLDKSPAPAPSTGDQLFVWAHEDRAYGHGLGMTAVAMTGPVELRGDQLAIQLQNVRLIPNPFGFKRLHGQQSRSEVLKAADADRSPRAWVVPDDERAVLESLIDEFGRAPTQEQIARLALDADPWDAALTEESDQVKAELVLRKARPGQGRFRENAFERHAKQCVFTKTRIDEVLEAAHAIPHTGHPQFERPDNSLLLRRDVHALYDAFLITIRPADSTLLVSPAIADGLYGKLAGRKVNHQLAKKPLEFHFRQYRKRLGDGGQA